MSARRISHCGPRKRLPITGPTTAPMVPAISLFRPSILPMLNRAKRRKIRKPAISPCDPLPGVIHLLLTEFPPHYRYHCRNAIDHPLIEIAIPELRGNDIADDTATLQVSQNPFQAVADFDTQLPIVLGNEQQGAIVEIFLARVSIVRPLLEKNLRDFRPRARELSALQFVSNRFFPARSGHIPVVVWSRGKYAGIIVDSRGKGWYRYCVCFLQLMK